MRAVTGHAPSYELPRVLPLLPTVSRALPCVAAPTEYDEDAPAAIRRRAARRCQRCPMLAECGALAEQLTAAGAIPRGVLGGNYAVGGYWRRA
jgi:hypothetical protein